MSLNEIMWHQGWTRSLSVHYMRLPWDRRGSRSISWLEANSLADRVTMARMVVSGMLKKKSDDEV